MALVEHAEITPGNLHVVCQWEYANAAARTSASGFVAADVGKFALQTDDFSVWVLAATTPTWVRVGDNWVAAPATSTSTGTAGQRAYDAFYLYICVATDTWVRTPLSSW